MRFIILTQFDEMVFVDNIVEIYPSLAEFDDGTPTVYGIQAETVLATGERKEDLTLGLYRTEEACVQAYEALRKAICSNVENYFHMPVEEED